MTNSIEDNTKDCHGCNTRWWDCEAKKHDIGDGCCIRCNHLDPAVHVIDLEIDENADYLVSDEHGEPLGVFRPQEIIDEGFRFAFALAEVCGDEDKIRLVEQETLNKVGSATFGYVCANALHVMTEVILKGAFDVAKAHGTDLQSGMAAFARGETP